MSAMIPSGYLAQQKKEVQVWLSPEVKKPQTLTKKNYSQLPAPLHCCFCHASIDFDLCFLPKLAGEFVIAMVCAPLFLRYSLFSVFCYPAINHNSMI